MVKKITKAELAEKVAKQKALQLLHNKNYRSKICNISVYKDDADKFRKLAKLNNHKHPDFMHILLIKFLES